MRKIFLSFSNIKIYNFHKKILLSPTKIGGKFYFAIVNLFKLYIEHYYYKMINLNI
jgi:hypothetical protein